MSSSDIYFIDVRYGSKVDMPGEDKRSRFSFPLSHYTKHFSLLLNVFYIHREQRQLQISFPGNVSLACMAALAV